MNPNQRLAYLIAIASVVNGMGFDAQAQIQIAEDLLVNVDATAVDIGTLTTIQNSGLLGGVFEARGGGATVPVIGQEGGTRGIRFDGGDFMQLVAAAGGALIVPPGGIVGAARTASIEVWAYNDNVLAEETMVSWGRRGGGPDGSNMSFNYGWHGAFGAVGHWGAPDIGWFNAGGAPAPSKWHHLVYTYDGTTTRVYSDGVLMNQEGVTLNTHANTSIQLAAQLDADGTTVTGGLRGSLTLARVRIHDGTLSEVQIRFNYDLERSDFIDPPVVSPAFLTALPAHRWSFNEAASANAADLPFSDSIGTSHGTVRGAGAQFTGSRLTLAGGASGTQGYGDLPNGLLSVNSTNNGGSGAATLEGWVRVTGSRTWARIFDFGSTTVGEILAPGSTGNGGDYLFYSAQTGGDTAVHTLELRNEDPPGGGVTTRNFGSFGTFNTDLHIAISWDEASGTIRVYENGRLNGNVIVDDAMSQINDVNVWLGRSNWTADQNMQGEFDEFRIYPRILSDGEILGNFQAGPNTLNTGESPVSIVDQPANASGLVDFPVSFTAAVGGTPPVSLQWQRNGVDIPGATSATYSFVASAVDNGAAYSLVASNFASGSAHVVSSTPATLTVVATEISLRHRYMFDEGSGTVAHDFLGGAHGTVVNAGTFGDGRLTLDGTTGYLNLPNDLVTNLESITIEAWVQDDGSSGWARIFDFGNSSAGEDFVAGTAGAAGTQYMFLSLPSGLGNLRGAYTVSGGGAAEQLIEWVGNRPPSGQLLHIVWISRGPSRTGRLYVDGTLVGSNSAVTLTPAALGPTSNNWLGRAQFNDPFFRGQFDEFRIWSGAMTPSQVTDSFTAGPNADVGGGVRLSITLESDGKLKISWPVAAADYFLETAPSLGPDAAWDLVFDAPVEEDGSFVVRLAPGSAPAFYRLSR